MKRSLVAVLALVAVAIAAAGGYWLGQNKPAASAPAVSGPAAAPANAGAAPGVAVEAVKVALAPMPQMITAVGSLRSDESVTLRPEVAGRISAIQFQEGQPIAKGTTMVRLDPAINEAEYEQAKANLWLAKTKYERAIDLQKQGFISSQAKDEAENNLRLAEAAIALAQAHLAKTVIKAPFSGIVGLRSVSLGDYVKEGQDLVNLESIDPLKVDFRVPEVYLKQVSVGQSLEIGLDALPGKTYEGKVFAINPLVDAGGRAIVIRAQVRNADTALRPGMFARVRLITKNERDTLVVPEQALVPQGEDQYVFKVADGKVTRAKVETGQRRDARVELTKGVDAGDVVVTAGQLKLRDGMPVTIAPTATPVAADNAPPAAKPATPAQAGAAPPRT
jgi:membrane fusion protein (multidrug efflux system)